MRSCVSLVALKQIPSGMEGDEDGEKPDRMEARMVINIDNQEDYISASLMVPAPSLSSSISLAKEASKMRMREKTRKISKGRRIDWVILQDFCDLVVTSQLAESVIKVSETVFNEINAVQSQEDNNDGVFVVEALFPATAGVTTTLTPELDVLLENIETSSRSHSLQVVNAMPRILSAAALLPADARRAISRTNVFGVEDS